MSKGRNGEEEVVRGQAEKGREEEQARVWGRRRRSEGHSTSPRE